MKKINFIIILCLVIINFIIIFFLNKNLLLTFFISCCIFFFFQIYIMKKKELTLYFNEVLMILNKINYPTTNSITKIALTTFLIMFLSCALIWITDNLLVLCLKRIF